MLAELWGLRDGLLQAVNLNIELLEVEGDSRAAIDLINSTDTNNSLNYSIVSNCKRLLDSFRSNRLFHAYREENKITDYLALIGANNASFSSLCLFPDTPFL